MSRFLKLLISFGVSFGLIYWVFRDVDLKLMGSRFADFPPGHLVLFVISLVVMQLARTFRWAALTSPFAQLSLRTSLKITSIGNALIVLLPLRLGEFARPLLTANEAKVSVTSGIGAVAVERTLDGLFSTLLLFCCLAALPSSYTVPLSLQTAGIAALLLFSGALIVIIGNLLAQEMMRNLIKRILGRLLPSLTDKLLDLLDAFTQGLKSLPNVKTIAQVFFWTAVFWVSEALGFFCVMEGFGWDIHWLASPLMLTVIVLAIMLPAGPGFLGTYQSGILVTLTIFNISPTEAMAFGLVVYPLMLLITVAWGGYFVVQDQMKLANLLSPLQKPSHT